MAYLKTGHFICSCFKEECNKDCPSYKKFTHKKNNADRIRSMSDEELAEFLLNRDLAVVGQASKAVGFTYKVDRESCLVNVIDWLKQEESELDGQN